MKRKIAFLLAVVLIVSAGFMAYATEPGNGAQATAAAQKHETREPAAQPAEEESQASPGDVPGTSGTEGVQNPGEGEGQAPVTATEPP